MEKKLTGPGVERGMVFQQGALFEWLTVNENVNFGLRMKKEDPIKTAEKVEEWLDIVGLQGFGEYSYLPIIWRYAAKSSSSKMFN